MLPVSFTKAVFAILFTAIVSPSAANAGANGGGGGGEIKKNFMEKANLAVAYLWSLKQDRIDISELGRVAANAQVEPKTVLLDSEGNPLANQEFLYAFSLRASTPVIQLRMRSEKESQKLVRDLSWQGKYETGQIGLDDVVHELFQASQRYANLDDGYKISRGYFQLHKVTAQHIQRVEVECGTDEKLNSPSLPPGIGARLNDCAKSPVRNWVLYTNKEGRQTIWKLVSRKLNSLTGKVSEVWQDSHTRFLWGDTLSAGYYSWAGDDYIYAWSACTSLDGRASVAGITEKHFDLPTKADFEQAELDGIRTVLPSIGNRLFWSSGLLPFFGYPTFNGSTGSIIYHGADKFLSVRCVAH